MLRSPRVSWGLRLVLAAGVMMTPGLVMLGFVYGWEGASLRDFVPHYFPLDDLMYWRQVYTFSAAGFDGGYYVEDELAAPASFAHFGPHGPLFPAVYGLLARVGGWQPYSPPLANALVLALALGVWIAALRLTFGQLIAAGAVVLTTWPVLFYVPSAMQESLQQALAIGLTLAVVIALRRGPTLPRWALLVMLAGVFFAALLRLTWIFLAFPLLVIAGRRVNERTVAGAGVLTLLLLVGVQAITHALGSPYRHNFISRWQDGVTDALQNDGLFEALDVGASMLGDNVAENLDFFNQGVSLEIGQRYQVLFLAAVFVGWWGWAWWRQHHTSRAGGDRPPQAVLEAGFHAYNLVFIFLVNLLFYLMAGWRDYRVMGAHLLLTGLALVATSRYRLVALVVVTNLVLAVPFKNYYFAYVRAYLGHDHAAITAFEQATREVLVYDPNADSAWCNTLLIHYHRSYAPPLMTVPAGIGISYFNVVGNLELPVKSRYVLLREPDYLALRDSVRLQHLVSTSLGELYLNLDAACSQETHSTHTLDTDTTQTTKELFE